MRLKELRKATRETLDELRAAKWFACVGQPLPEVRGSKFRRVRSWPRAFSLACGGWWSMVNYAHSLDRDDAAAKKRLMRRTRALEALLFPVARELASRKIAQGAPRLRFPLEATSMLSFEVAMIALEKELEEAIPPDFFIKIGYWLCEGYYPCGQSADGRLVIY